MGRDSSPPIVLKIPPRDAASHQSHENESNLENSNQDPRESVKVPNSSERLTTFEKSGEDERQNERPHPSDGHRTDRDTDRDCREDHQLERQPKFNDISEQREQELTERQGSKDLYMELLNQDSFIDGPFHLDNTHSLEKFRELEKMCENQAEGNHELQVEPKLVEADSRTADEAPAEASGEILP